jgi:hypothetical protein
MSFWNSVEQFFGSAGPALGPTTPPEAVAPDSPEAVVVDALRTYSEWRGPAAVANVLALASYAGTVLIHKLRLRSLPRRSERPANAPLL